MNIEIPRTQLYSDYLFNLMEGKVSKEDCEWSVKQNLLSQIRAYMATFQGNLYGNISNISEEELSEIANAVKVFCRIEVNKGFCENENKSNLSQ